MSNKKELSKKRKVAGYILTIVFFIFIFKFCANLMEGDGTSNNPGPDKYLAYGVAEDEVKARLKSPSTADFPIMDIENHTTKIDSVTFKINSYVDSQNGFGATIRSNWGCTIEFTAKNKYRVSNLYIE